jgi:hypothetical protein
MKLKRGALVVVGVLLAAALPSVARPTPARADTPQPFPYYLPLDQPTSIRNIDGEKVLVHFDLALRAGESRWLLGNLEAASSTTATMEMGVAVKCLNSQQQLVGPAAWTGRNHEGSDYPYVPTQGTLTLDAALLFTAPSADTYTCELIGYDGDPVDDYLIAIKGGSRFQGTGSWLEISSSDEVSSSWWQNQICESNPEREIQQGRDDLCTYIGGSGAPSYANIFVPVTPHVWEAPGNATAANASATVELTTCYHGTGSCRSTHWGDSHGATVSTYLAFVQLDAHSQVCSYHQTNQVSYNISDEAHHFMISYYLGEVPISPTCGSRRFVLWVYIADVSGNPVKIDGTRLGDGHESYTNALVYSSLFRPAVPVPNVLRLAELPARSALSQASLNPGDVSYVMDPAPPGTVIGQTAAGGTVEPAQSPVNLTVSLGDVDVPYVLASSEADATDEISRLGLIPNVTRRPVCLDPGNVIEQSPPSGVHVVPGTTVHLTVDSATRHSCNIQ